MNRELAPVPQQGEYLDGATLRDNRRGLQIEYRKASTSTWENFFGKLIEEVRWDLFEDFLYLTTEMHLGKFVEVVKNTNWDDYFMAMFRQLGKLW